MEQVLFLLKSGQAKQFFQQNITFLAQPEGYEITTRYKQRWVHHTLDDPLPEQVVILYAEPPYEHYLAVRQARLSRYELDESDESIQLYLVLGRHLAPERLEERDALIKAVRPTEQAFVFAGPPLPTSPPTPDPERNWRALVHHLASPAFAAQENPYTGAVFALAQPLASADGQPMRPRGHIRVGHSYQQGLLLLAPGLTNGDLDGVRVQLDYPRLTAFITPHGEVREGEVTLLVQPLRALTAPWTVTIYFRPTTVPTGPVHLSLPPIDAFPVGREGGEGGAQEPLQRLQLFEWLAPKLPARDQLRLIDRYLLPRGDGEPPDPHLLLARAAVLKKEGQMIEAMETLLQVPGDQLNDEMIVLLLECGVAAHRQLPFIALLDQLSDWDDGQRVQRIVRVIATLPEEQILPLVQHVCHLAPIYAHLVWQEIATALQQPRHRLALVQFLQGEQPTQPRGYLLLTPSEAYHYLARGADPDRLSDDHLDQLVRVGLQSSSPTGIATYFLEWMTRHLRHAERETVEQVQQQFGKALAWLATQQEESAVLMLMDAMKRTGLAESALWLAMGRVDDAQRVADFERAERWLREARNSVSFLPPESRSAMINLIKDEDGRIKEARHAIAETFAPRYGSDPGLAPILKLYGIDCVDAFWADLSEVMSTNEHVVRQLIERLEQLHQFAQQSGSSATNIHSLSSLQGNVSRMELTDSARLIFKKMGRTIRLIALFPNHDAYDAAIKQRFELMGRILRG